jgi:hypothetical protein
LKNANVLLTTFGQGINNASALHVSDKIFFLLVHSGQERFDSFDSNPRAKPRIDDSTEMRFNNHRYATAIQRILTSLPRNPYSAQVSNPHNKVFQSLTSNVAPRVRSFLLAMIAYAIISAEESPSVLSSMTFVSISASGCLFLFSSAFFL